MPDVPIEDWLGKIRERYENYLSTLFFFADGELRKSFRDALNDGGKLLKGPFREEGKPFKSAGSARELAKECFPGKSEDLEPALRGDPLYAHQDRAIRAAREDKNIVIATGTASGKTESFLYPILFELYRQHLSGELGKPGVRALILYPMNALANDQRERLGEICRQLKEAKSSFQPTFGQYIGQTPKDSNDRFWRQAGVREEERRPGELVFRKEMRKTPPHILLTNYSMLEYLLIRPDDSPLFDNELGEHWQFIVLDEAHQYRGTKGMEMGMLLRRLKQRLRDGGRQAPFRCIATSATISSSEGEKDRQLVAEFAAELFGEQFTPDGVIFSSEFEKRQADTTNRYHAFLRALEGAFLVHNNGKDKVVLNRKGEDEAQPLEIALCRGCGQHYYVGREWNGKLQEAIRDPSHDDFGVDYYLPLTDDEHRGNNDMRLCRHCGELSHSETSCGCGATIHVKKCEPHEEQPDQIKKCETCGYSRGTIGDPVQEIVHGADGPNSVIATALHELLPEDRRKVLTFADSRQEAAFFAWYAEDSYTDLRNRNFLLRAMKMAEIDEEGLSIDDLRNRLFRQWEQAGLFADGDSKVEKNRTVLTVILREALTDERRLSLAGVGLVKWFVKIPGDFEAPKMMLEPPWNLDKNEALRLVEYLLDGLRPLLALELPEDDATPVWDEISSHSRRQTAYRVGRPGGSKNVRQWGGAQSAVVAHYLHRLLENSNLSKEEKQLASVELMEAVWRALRKCEGNVLSRAEGEDGAFRLNSKWVRIKLAGPEDVWECDACATLTAYNIRGVCPRKPCPGTLAAANQERLRQNHYRILYESETLPPRLRAEEHTAQIDSDRARKLQDDFKRGGKQSRIHLLSSSTTFEVGVDLGDLDVVFLRNVPPESFNYTQRVGRAGRGKTPGLAVTYCRRNPHDLYHYEDPKKHVLEGVVRPPRLRMTNRKIILRHVTATALSLFFRGNDANKERFKNVCAFIGDWRDGRAVRDLGAFCRGNKLLADSLREIVPADLHEWMGFDNDAWVDKIAGPESHLATVEAEVCSDRNQLVELRKRYIEEELDTRLAGIKRRRDTIEREKTLDFLSRKAVIPKYGFPVDVVELEIRTPDGAPTGVQLQRDLSQAIAEYAPGSKVVANKKEWESCGIKVVQGKSCRIQAFEYDDQHNFKQWNENAPDAPAYARKYLVPEFGFVTPMKKPKPPQGRARRLYTTRPFFSGFDGTPESAIIGGVELTKALPGRLVILCEGKKRQGFFICLDCGAHMTERKAKHTAPLQYECKGTLKNFSLGHELATDVMRLQFPGVQDTWDAYSVGYAVLLGAAEMLGIPSTDLNVTVSGTAIVLYDDVPGGAGLVARLEQQNVFEEALQLSAARVSDDGAHGCDSSCYGCLRSYRNQFAHPHLARQRAHEILQAAIDEMGK